MMDSIIIIVVTYNCDHDLHERMHAVQKAGVDLLIVDNGSETMGRSIVEQYTTIHGIGTILNSANMGIAYALNQGVSYASEHGYQWILTLDQDSLVTPGMIETLLNVYESLDAKEKEITAGLFAVPIEKSIAHSGDFRSETDNMNYAKVKVGITSGNLLRTEIFAKVGLFDEKLFIDYVDHDFYLRLASAGYQLLECEGAKLIHQRGNYTQRKFIGKLIETSNHSALRKYYITRNRMYMWKTYGKSHPDFVLHDKKTFRMQMLKLLLVEDDRWAKLKMVVKGIMDFNQGRFGKLEISASSIAACENAIER